jgi:hypothetical protein
MAERNGALAAEMRESRPTERLSGFNECLFGDGTDEDSTGAPQLQRPFADQRTAALALLNGYSRLTRKAGSFLGQLAVDPTPLSEAQLEWLQTLLDRADLPPLEMEAAHG